jgi:hypothetical protein
MMGATNPSCWPMIKAAAAPPLLRIGEGYGHYHESIEHKGAKQGSYHRGAAAIRPNRSGTI